MGEKLSKDYSIAAEYQKLQGMPFIGDHDFDVDLEKECFMSVNVIRANPKAFKTHFEHVMGLKDGYDGKKGNKFLKWLEKLPQDTSFAPLSVDRDVMAACRENNENLKSVTKDKDIPTDGNTKVLARIMNSTKSTDIVEFTYWSTWKHTAHELVLLNILVDFERHDTSIILCERAMRCGFAYAGHPKFGNMFQAVFVMQKSNNML